MVTNMRIFLSIFVRGIFIDFVCITQIRRRVLYKNYYDLYIYIFVKSKTVDDKVFVLCLLYALYIQKVFLSRFFTKKKKKNEQTTSNGNLVRAPSENTQTLTGERWDKKKTVQSHRSRCLSEKKGSHSRKRHIRI